MSNFMSIDDCLKEIENRYINIEKIRRKLAKFDDIIQIKFLDTNRSVVIVIQNDQGIEIKDQTEDDSAPVKIEFTEEQVLMDMYNKDLGAVKAYSTGKVKVIEGKIRNLLKLKSLMF